MVVRVHEREGPAVEGHAEHGLLGLRPFLDEVVERVLDVEEEVLALLLRPGVERRVVARLSVPLAVVVVAHDVDEVEVFVHERDVVGDVDRGSRGADGRSQDEVATVRVKSCAEIPDESDEVTLVLRDAAALG